MSAAVDMDHLRQWIDRTETVRDWPTPRLAAAYEATLDVPPREFRAGDEAPLGLHWCLAIPAAPASALGRDGHPKREGFMPPIPLPRRMWAGGELVFHAPLAVGVEVERRSRIASLDLKHGRTGPLIFLNVEHSYDQGGGARIVETQTLVYREDAPAGKGKERAAPAPDASPVGETVRTLTPDPVLLFRYSALTFNGHRIHYDQAYAREVEGYPDIVVHGPLIATLLMRAAAEAAPKQRLASFAFRGLAPLSVNQPLSLMLERRNGDLQATAVSENRAMMAATAAFPRP
jgi:3-methylfumaryl-CoA hydratase